MELRHIRYFVAVAEELHFRRAAERLRLSQPPLSLQIRELERELGAVLFERSRQKVTLTAAGRCFLQHAREILEDVKSAKNGVRRTADGEIGELRIAFTQSSEFLPLLPRTIHRFRSRFPEVTFTLRQMPSTEQMAGVVNRTIDMGISRKPSGRLNSAIRLTKLYDDPLMLAVHQRDALAREKSTTIGAARDRLFIASPRESGSGLRDILMGLCRAEGFLPRIVQEAAEVPSIVSFVAAGVGVGVVPASARCIHIDGVRFVPLSDRRAESALYLVTHAGDHSTLMEALRNMLLEATALPQAKAAGPGRRRSRKPFASASGDSARRV